MTVAARIPDSDEIIIITHAFMRLASFIRPMSRGEWLYIDICAISGYENTLIRTRHPP